VGSDIIYVKLNYPKDIKGFLSRLRVI